MSAEPYAPSLFAAILALSSCASSSIRSDLGSVQRLTSTAVGRDLDGDAVPDETGGEARAILQSPMGSDDAVRVALLNNRPLRATLRELGIARGRLMQAGLLPNPVVEFDLRSVRGGSQPLQGDLRVEYDLTSALLAPRRAGVARAGLEVARTRAAEVVVSLGFRTRAGYFAVQAADARVLLAQRSIDALVAERDAARALHSAGNLPRLGLSTVEAAYEQGRVAVAQCELDLLDARERLNVLLGVSGDDTRWTLPADRTGLSAAVVIPDGVESRALEANLGLAATRHRLEAIARATGLFRTQGWLPDITVDFHGEQDGTNLELGGGARVAIPLFDRQQGNLRASEAEFDGLRERYVGMAVELRSQTRRAVGRLRSAHLRARQWEGVIVPARRRVLDESVLQYNAMQLSVFQVLQVRRELLDAEMSAVHARRDFLTAAAAVDALLAGAVVEGDAMEPSSTREAGMAGTSSGAHKGDR